MINLLPYSYKQEVMYARKNVTLLRILLYMASAAIGVLILFGAGIVYTSQQIKTKDNEYTSKTTELAKNNVSKTYEDLNQISNNTKLALQVLSGEILFSKLITQIGTIIPPGTQLNSLSLEKDKIDSGISLSASTLDINTATQLQLNLQDKNNQVFEKADIDNVTCTPGPGIRYPCQVTIKATFLKEKNPYVFISPSATKSTEVKR